MTVIDADPADLADLAELALFEGCSAEDLLPVVEAISGRRHVAEGDIVCSQDEAADRWWIVIEGVADVTVDGLYTATVGPGETIGELALLDGAPRSATVTAVTDMWLHEVDGYAFLDALHRSPSLSLALLRELAGRIRSTNRRPQRPVSAPSVAAPTAAPSTPGRPGGVTAKFDPGAPGFHEDPAAHLGALREETPLHWSEVLNSWVVLRYEDVHRLCRSRSLIGSVSRLDVSERRSGWRMMINRDGADHVRLRRLVSRVFTPRAVNAWGERASSIVDRLLAASIERERLDVIADYALPLPAQVITEMLGLPGSDTVQMRDWSRILIMTLDPLRDPDTQEAIDEAGRAMSDYLTGAIEHKREHPAGDILSALIHARDDGDVLDDKEIVAQVIMLYIAGHETTLNLIGNGVVNLFRFPGQLALLRSSPDLDANAVEEVLRYEGPAQLTRRVTVEPVNVGDTTLPAGCHITLSLASANRDPRKWGATADMLDLARPGANTARRLRGRAALLPGRLACPDGGGDRAAEAHADLSRHAARIRHAGVDTTGGPTWSRDPAGNAWEDPPRMSTSSDGRHVDASPRCPYLSDKGRNAPCARLAEGG